MNDPGEHVGLRAVGPAPDRPDPASLARRRRRTVVAVAAGFLVILLLTLGELHLLRAKSVLVLVTFNFNVTLLVLLALLILRNVVKMVFERRRAVRGTRLRSKLVLTFVGLLLIPSTLLFIAAGGLISEALENWFDPRIESYLTGALDVAQVYTADARARTARDAAMIADAIGRGQLLEPDGRESLQQLLDARLVEHGLGLLQVFSAAGEELARSSDAAIPEHQVRAPDPQFFQEARQGRDFFAIEPIGEADLVRCGAPIGPAAGDGPTAGVLVVARLIPQNLARKIRNLSRDYATYLSQRQSMFETRALYLTVLLVLTLTIVFSATWLGFYIARTVTTPIESLADATRLVQEGDLDFQLDVTAFDEVGVLVESFNRMTAQLRSQRQAIIEGNEQLTRANAELERRTTTITTILENIATGVLGLDAEGRVTTFNPAAAALLQLPAVQALGQPFRELFAGPAFGSLASFLEQADRARSTGLREELRLALTGRHRTLMATSTPLRGPQDRYSGMVVVLEDITHLLRVQRIAAWQEVARRIAHEIKNPLTPIQLSAQRIERRISQTEPLPPELVRQCTATIISQVDDLKKLVDSFSRFARMPEADLRPGDLHKAIRETLDLYAGLGDRVALVAELAANIPLLSFDPEQIRRLIQNLVDNAIEAMKGTGRVLVRTSYDSTAGMVSLEIADEGPGVRPEDRDKLFLPYFSTKRRGSGLGLAIVARIVADHSGFIRVRDNEPRGTSILVELPVDDRRSPAGGGEV